MFQFTYLFALLGASSFCLTIVYARLVEDALDHELNEPVVLGAAAQWMSGIGGFPVARQKLLHQRIDLAKALHPRVAWIPILVLQIVGEPRQREQQTQIVVLVLGRCHFLQLTEDL